VAYALQVSSAASPASSATITGASCCSATGSGRPAGSGGSRPGTPTRGERHEDTIAREVREETGLTVKAGRLLKVRSGFQYRIEIYDEANLIGGVDGLASTRRKSWKPGCSTSTICRP
jgi:hypothetical protein